jgi:aryl-alcohol dehydrogenase-like predicted oxidoreductase
MLPIPGTLRIAHLEENVAALALTREEISTLDAVAGDQHKVSIKV